MLRYPRREPSDEPIATRLRELAAQRRRWGRRKLIVLLRREGNRDNHKRVHRIYKMQRLQVARRPRRAIMLFVWAKRPRARLRPDNDAPVEPSNLRQHTVSRFDVCLGRDPVAGAPKRRLPSLVKNTRLQRIPRGLHSDGRSAAVIHLKLVVPRCLGPSAFFRPASRQRTTLKSERGWRHDLPVADTTRLPNPELSVSAGG